MTLFTIFLLALITFGTRYLFLHPNLPLRLGPRMVRFLSFSAPAVLTSIWVPIVFLQDEQLNVSPTNPYLLAATLAILVSAKTKSVYLTVGVGVLVFVILRLW